MRKQIIPAVLAFCLALLLLPARAEAATAWKNSDLFWDYNASTKTLTISGTGEMPEVYRPFSSYKEEIEHVVIEHGVTSIAERVFMDYKKITDVSIPGTVKTIGESAFERCAALTRIVIPSGVTSIGKDAFYRCVALTSAEIPNSVTSIGEYAFYDCTALTGVVIPNGVTSIGEKAFSGCTALTRIEIPNSVTSIGESAFSDCENLVSATLPDGLTSIAAYTFSDCESLATIDIPAGVISIGDGAFYGCRTLDSIDLPAELETIGEDAFYNCTFSRLSIPAMVKKIGESAFSNEELVTLYIPSSVTGIAPYCFSYAELWDVYYGGTEEEWKNSPAYNSVKHNLNFRETVVHYGATGLPQYLVDNEGDLKNLIAEAYDTKAGLMDIRLSGDFALSQSIDIPSNTSVRIDLNGHSITSAPSNSATLFLVGGELTIWDSTVTAEPVVDTAHTANPVTYKSGGIIANGTRQNAVLVDRLGTLTLESGTIRATNQAVLVQGPTEEPADGTRSTFYMKNGYVEAQESAVAVFGPNVEARINGGALLSRDNATIAGNGLEQYADTHINLYGGTVISQSTTPGYIPCGIYHPQKGYLYLRSGAIYAEGGVGVLMRGGDLDVSEPWSNMEPVRVYVSGSGSGKVGDAGLSIEAGHAVVLDQKSGYYDSTSIWADIDESMVEAFKPFPYPADGYVMKYTESLSGVGPHTIYSFREAVLHTVTFNTNGGAFSGGGTTLQLQTDVNERITEWPEVPVRTGYVFKGWGSQENSSVGNVFSESYEFPRDQTLYAVWIPEGAHVITFMSFYESYSTHAIKVTDADGVLRDWPEVREDGTIVADNITRWFQGWHSTPFEKDDGHIEFAEDYAFTGDTTVYIYAPSAPSDGSGSGGDGYIRRLFVTFDANGGIGSITLTSEGSSVAKPQDPYRVGYTFTGWFTQREGGEEITTAAVPVTKSRTVYAHWSPTGGTTPGGSDNPGTTTPGGSDNPGGTTPGGSDNPGGTTPGGNDNPGGTTPGGSDNPGGTTPGGNDNPGATTPGGSDNPGTAIRYPVYTPVDVVGGSFSVSHSSAEEGALVTIQTWPYGSYDLDWVSVVRLDTGRELYLSGYYGGYSFIMPASSVEVQLGFSSRYWYSGGGSTGGGSSYVESSSTVNEPPAITKPANWSYRNGQVFHVSDGVVPDAAPLTRDMLISLLYNLDPTSSGEPTFWALQNNIIERDVFLNGLWGVDKTLSREQTAMILYSYAKYRGYSVSQRANLTGYADYSQIRSVARTAMSWANATGLMTGTSATTLSPRSSLNCGQANVILSRFVSTVAWSR